MAPRTLPERARAARIRAGFRNEAAAAKAIGCSRPTVIRWETDAKSIGDYLLRAARAYSVRPEWLAMESDDDGYPYHPLAYQTPPERAKAAVQEPETDPPLDAMDQFLSALEQLPQGEREAAAGLLAQLARTPDSQPMRDALRAIVTPGKGR